MGTQDRWNDLADEDLAMTPDDADGVIGGATAGMEKAPDPTSGRYDAVTTAVASKEKMLDSIKKMKLAETRVEKTKSPPDELAKQPTKHSDDVRSKPF